MSIGLDKVVGNIVDSCMERKEFVESLLKETQNLCTGFEKERNENAKKQKEELK